jgi:hypothetical protein
VVVYGVALDAGGFNARRKRGLARATRNTQNFVSQSSDLFGLCSRGFGGLRAAMLCFFLLSYK